MFNKNAVAARLKELRGPISQAEMARKVGIAQQGWARYESGKVVPGAEALHQICESSGVSADWLLGLPERRESTRVTAGSGAAVAIGSGTANASNCRDCPILLDFIKRRSGG